jgi:hypothetical protein
VIFGITQVILTQDRAEKDSGQVKSMQWTPVLVHVYVGAPHRLQTPGSDPADSRLWPVRNGRPMTPSGTRKGGVEVSGSEKNAIQEEPANF